LVIPQLILSGVIVPFDKLNPKISTPAKVPWYGEIITARWGYEALAVYQFKENEFESMFYEYDKVMSNADFKKNYWIKTLVNKVAYCRRNYQNQVKQLKVKQELLLIRNEIGREVEVNNIVNFGSVNSLYLDKLSDRVFDDVERYLSILKKYYLKRYNKASSLKDEFINSMQSTKEEKAEFLEKKRMYTNENLTSFVRNSNSLDRIIEYKHQLYQKIDPIYLDPKGKFIKAHFYAPHKSIFGYYVDTFWVNIGVIWFITNYLRLTIKGHFSKLEYPTGYATPQKTPYIH
jgi:hypothetical protein